MAALLVSLHQLINEDSVYRWPFISEESLVCDPIDPLSLVPVNICTIYALSPSIPIPLSLRL